MNMKYKSKLIESMPEQTRVQRPDHGHYGDIVIPASEDGPDVNHYDVFTIQKHLIAKAKRANRELLIKDRTEQLTEIFQQLDDLKSYEGRMWTVHSHIRRA